MASECRAVCRRPQDAKVACARESDTAGSSCISSGRRRPGGRGVTLTAVILARCIRQVETPEGIMELARDCAFTAAPTIVLRHEAEAQARYAEARGWRRLDPPPDAPAP